MSPALVNKLKLWLGLAIAVLSAIVGQRTAGDGFNLSEELVPVIGSGGALAASLWSVYSGASGLHTAAPPVVVTHDLNGMVSVWVQAAVQATEAGNFVARDAAVAGLTATLKAKDAAAVQGGKP
jgi:hypothetical protein